MTVNRVLETSCCACWNDVDGRSAMTLVGTPRSLDAHA